MNGTLEVMGVKGDTKLSWNSDNRAEIDAARQMFDELRGKNYLAFSVKGGGKKGNQIFSFDPEAERLIMIPPISGG